MPSRMLDELARGPIDRGRAVGSDEQAALVEQLSAIREELLEVADGWTPCLIGAPRVTSSLVEGSVDIRKRGT